MRLLPFILLLISFSSFGQTYHKFIDSNIYWDVGHADMGYICMPYGNDGPWRFSIGSDTIINSTTYKMFRAYDFINLNTPPSPNCPPFAIDTLNHLENTFGSRAIMREDTILKKVYKYDTFLQQEVLWYDFDAQIGDTIFYDPPIIYFVVDTIYNIVTLDGKTRKYFEYNNNMAGGLGGYYIEGLGGRGGPFFEPLSYFEGGPWLMCISDTNQNAIHTPSGCYSFATGLNEITKAKSKLLLYPNPTTKELIINIDQNFTALIMVDITGKIIKSFTEKVNRIDVADLPKGIYFIQLIREEGIITRKFVKQ